MLLFPLERDYGYLMGAIESGEITLERLKDAVRRILRMKAQVRLFEDQAAIADSVEVSGDIAAVAQEIADKAITVIRNSQNLIPLSLPKGSKFLLINIQRNRNDMGMPQYMEHIKILVEELEKRGYQADMISAYGIDHRKLEEDMKGYDCILFNCRINPAVYLGGTNRINWDNIMCFWRGVGVAHPRVIFTSFGDPYKLYDLPFLRTYVNAYSHDEVTFRAFIKVLLGEIPAEGKSPVALKGFFERETD
jgi:beta-N-acetylhexosaminidase